MHRSILRSFLLPGLLTVPGATATLCPAQWAPPTGAHVGAVRAEDVTQLRHLTFEQRTEFVAAIRAAAGRLDRRIATLTAARREAALPAVIDALARERAELDASIERVDRAGRSEWEAARDQALAELSEAQAAFDHAAMS